VAEPVLVYESGVAGDDGLKAILEFLGHSVEVVESADALRQALHEASQDPLTLVIRDSGDA
jgi:DNA-binding NarL/FixJ family response regulator